MAYAEFSQDGRVILLQPVIGAFEMTLPSGQSIKLAPGESAEANGVSVRIRNGAPPAAGGEMFLDTIVTNPQPKKRGKPAKKEKPKEDPSLRLSRMNSGEPLPKPPDGAPTIEGYAITKKLGQGGMGAVWKAFQMGTGRSVAIKTMTMEHISEEARARFSIEIEVTAQLDHPNIGRLYESHVDDQVCFYAMELIEGTDLEGRTEGDLPPLTQEESLLLMLGVCRGVQFAHQKGIIHRDLKPGNIMITTEGQPKVVDFGLAKLVENDKPGMGDSKLTNDGTQLGTPAYMSPEQVRASQDLIDTRSDVYALGVILYELLVGAHPHGLDGNLFLLFSRIMNEEVHRPRSIKPSLDKDLEALLLKALGHEPSERYPTAGEMADDIQRFLDGEPLLAQPQTAVYVLKKKIIKHRRKVLTAVLLMIVGIIFAIGAFIEIRVQRDAAQAAQIEAQVAQKEAEKQHSIALEERARAEERFKNVRTLARVFIHDFDTELQKGPTQARSLLVQTAADYLSKLMKDSEGRPDLVADIAEAHRKIGEVQQILLKDKKKDAKKGKSSIENPSIQSFEKSARLFTQLLEGSPQDPKLKYQLALTYNRIAEFKQEHGNTADTRDTASKLYQGDAESTFKHALGYLTPLLNVFPKGLERDQTELAIVHNLMGLGRLMKEQKNSESAASKYNEALAHLDPLFSQLPSTPSTEESLLNWSLEVRKTSALANIQLGNILRRSGDHTAAEKHFKIGADLLNALTQEYPNDVTLLRLENNTNDRFALLSIEQGKITDAHTHYQKTVDIPQHLIELDPLNADYHRLLAGGHRNLGGILNQQGEFDASIEHLLHALGAHQDLSDASPSSMKLKNNLAWTLLYLGKAQIDKGLFGDASGTFSKLITISSALHKAAPKSGSIQRLLIWGHVHRAVAQNKQGKRKSAKTIAALQRAQELLDPLLKQSPNAVYSLHVRAVISMEHGQLLQDRNPGEAREFLASALDDMETILKKSPEDRDFQLEGARSKTLLARLLIETDSDGDLNKAAGLLTSARATLEAVFAVDQSNAHAHAALGVALLVEGELHNAKKEPEKACKAIKKSAEHLGELAGEKHLIARKQGDLMKARALQLRCH